MALYGSSTCAAGAVTRLRWKMKATRYGPCCTGTRDELTHRGYPEATMKPHQAGGLGARGLARQARFHALPSSRPRLQQLRLWLSQVVGRRVRRRDHPFHSRPAQENEQVPKLVLLFWAPRVAGCKCWVAVVLIGGKRRLRCEAKCTSCQNLWERHSERTRANGEVSAAQELRVGMRGLAMLGSYEFQQAAQSNPEVKTKAKRPLEKRPLA